LAGGEEAERLSLPRFFCGGCVSLFNVKIPDYRSIIDVVLIDTDYNGKVFNIILSDVPEKKNDLVEGTYKVIIPKGKTTIAVKIIDKLGEELLITKTI